MDQGGTVWLRRGAPVCKGEPSITGKLGEKKKKEGETVRRFKDEESSTDTSEPESIGRSALRH